MRNIVERLTDRIAVKLGILIQKAERRIAQETLPAFGNTPKNLRIDLPRRIVHPERMLLGDDIWLGPGSLLIAILSYPTAPMRHLAERQPYQEFDPRITIGSRVTSTADLQIAAVQEVSIGDDVMFASNINITDGLHGYENADEPYRYQEMQRIAPIRIGRGCWIGQNVVILPGVTIGELSIIGANSVVTKSIPARCIALGAPARATQRWDESSQNWVPITDSGD